jgi:HPt (histidine-containing phosphotransfer) domain-containing protein
MFEQQISTDGYLTKASETSAWGADVESESVDMTVLLSFEELQRDSEGDLLVELIALYLQDAPERIDAIRTAVAKADRDSLRRAAHSLKGSSGTLGVRQLATICEELECLANDKLTPSMTAALHRLEAEFVRVQAALISELHRRQLPYHARV